MRAAVPVEPGRVELRRIARPSIGSDELLVAARESEVVRAVVEP